MKTLLRHQNFPLATVLLLLGAGLLHCAPGYCTAVPPGASALGYTECVINNVPAVSQIAPGKSGNYQWFSGQWWMSPEPALNLYTTTNGVLTISLNGCLVSYPLAMTAGSVPLLSGANGFYAEFDEWLSSNNSDHWPAVWLEPAEHNGWQDDCYPALYPSDPANYERWMELDVDEGGFGPGLTGTVHSWTGVNPNYANTQNSNNESSTTLDRTVKHTFGASYNPTTSTVAWWVDGVKQMSAGSPAVPKVAAQQHFYLIMNAASHGANTSYTMMVSGVRAYVPPPAFAASPAATPNPANVGQTVSFSSPAASGGSGPLNFTPEVPGTLTYTWTFGDGVGKGTGLTPTYAYTGAGKFTATVTATDSLGVSASATVSVTVNGSAAPPVINSALTETGTVGTAFTYNITATNSPTSYNATNLPAGWSIDTGTGAITGTPTAAGTASVALSATNATGTGAATLALTIAPGIPTIIWANPASITYGTALGSTQLNATAGVPGNFTYAPASGTVFNAGAGQVLTAHFTPADAVDYNSAVQTVAISVLAAPLTVTANTQSIVYGAATPLTYTYAGLINGDASAAFTGVLATSSSGVGTYPITQGTLKATGNYTIGAFNSANLTVTPAALTITANDQSKVYGATLPALTAGYSGLVNGDTAASLTTQPALSTAATAASPVGSYPIAEVSGAASPNYTISFVGGTLAVTPAALTITANDQSKVYGAMLPALTAGYSGWVNGDTAAGLTTPPALSTTATAASAVGSYPITASGAVDANYAITYVAGTLTVSKAAQDIVFGALAAVRLDQSPLKPTAASSSGLPVTLSVVSGPATSDGTSVTLTGVGQVVLNASQNGDANYNAAATVQQSFDVTPGQQTITFNAPPPQFYPGTLMLAATASSGLLPVVYQVLSGPATVSGGTLTLTGVGTVVVQASQAGNADWNAAADATQSFISEGPLTVSKLSAAFKFGVSGKDSCALAGTLPDLAAGFSFANTSVTVDASGAESGAFAFNAKGKAPKTAGDSFSAKVKDGQALFSAKLVGTFSGDWGIDPTVSQSKQSLPLVVTVTLDGATYVSTVATLLTAKAHKGGSFKLK